MKINYLVVHCSATRPSQDIGAEEINRMHILRGFKKIGYHFVIKRDGCIEKGREVDEAGAHVQGYNSQSLGICLIGGVAEDGKTPEANFTEVQMDTLRGLLMTLNIAYPDAIIQGHRDFPHVHKDCPCFDVKSWWESVSTYEKD